MSRPSPLTDQPGPRQPTPGTLAAMDVPECDVAIVGAGPYGLSIASHLHRRGGPAVRVFGDPMSFWRDRMPSGMLLRSPYVASNIADPDRSLTLSDYRSA